MSSLLVVHVLGLCCEFRLLCCCGLAVLACSLGSLFARAWYEASRTRLRTHQVLAFSEALHARLGSECMLQAVALDIDVWRHVAENVRERHGHEHMCSQLAQAGQTWFEVTVEGLIAEGVPR